MTQYTKRGKIYQITTTLPNGCKNIANNHKNTNIFNFRALQNLPKLINQMAVK
jgi:hypothetical protein